MNALWDSFSFSFRSSRRRTDRSSSLNLKKTAWPGGFVLRHLVYRSRQVGWSCWIKYNNEYLARRPRRIFCNSISPNVTCLVDLASRLWRFARLLFDYDIYIFSYHFISINKFIFIFNARIRMSFDLLGFSTKKSYTAFVRFFDWCIPKPFIESEKRIASRILFFMCPSCTHVSRPF